MEVGCTYKNSHDAFAQEIAGMTDLTNITGGDISQMMSDLEEGTYFWEIDLTYTDGTWFEFRILDNTMILRYIQLDHYETSGNGITIGHYYQDVVYPTYISKIEGDEIMPRFVASVNEFIELVIHE